MKKRKFFTIHYYDRFTGERKFTSYEGSQKDAENAGKDWYGDRFICVE